MNKREYRLKKLSDIGDSIQQGIDYARSLLPGASHNEIAPITIQPPVNAEQFDLNAAVAYNSKSEETFKQHEDEIKKILGTTAEWHTPEFAQAVYQWQKANGLVGKWIDGKFGPVTMSAMTKSDTNLQSKYPIEATTPWLPDGKVKLRLTGYWPFSARRDERKMEGGIFDRKMPDKYKNQPDSKEYQNHVLHTAEQYLADPIRHPFVSLSGDDAIWPYGQEIIIPWTNNQQLRGRVVDTGSHFRGAGKVYRTEGYEPIDVCVDSAQTKVPTHVTAQVVGEEPKQPVIAKLVLLRIKNAKLKAIKLIIDGIHD